MPLILADRVRDTTTTTGTGTVTLSGTAPTGYQNFSVIGNGNTTYYTINAGSQWEVGIGTYSSTGPTLARNTVLESSNANALVNFAAGVKDVFVTYPSDKSVIQDASGNVGIGTSSPGTRLDVLSSSDTPANFRSAGANTYIRFINSVNTEGYIGYLSSDLTFWTTSERMRITSAGNVGIGTSAPSALLNVYSATGAFIDLFGDAGTTISAVRSSTDATGANMVLRKARGTTASRNAVASGDTMGTLFFSAFGGTSNRNIASIVGTVGTYTSDADISSNLIFNTTPTGSVTATERMRIDGSGNVGIGTSAPADLLDVNAATANAGYTDFVAFRQVNGTGTSTRMLFGQNTTNNMFIEVANQANTKGNLLLQPFGGNVGIGTDNPVARLDVAGGAIRVGNTHSMQFRNAAGTGVAVYTLQSDDNFVVYNAAGTPISSFSQGATNIAIYGSNTSNRMQVDSINNVTSWTVNGTERARINNSGQFLVGTTTGGRTVCINAADNWIRQSNPTRSWLIGPSNGANFLIFDETGGGTRLTIETNGVVTASGDFRAPIFYDSNNTAFFVDPASNSVLNTLTVSANDTSSGGGVAFGGSANAQFIRGRNSDGASATLSNLQLQSWNGIGFGPSLSGQLVPIGENAAWVDCRNGDLYGRRLVIAGQDMRAPIFYDSNNTAFFVDPATTSVTNVVRANALQFSNGNTANDLANGTYNILCDPSARIALYLGNGDPANYYDNTTHWFRNRATANMAIINSSGIQAPVFLDINNTGYYLDPTSNTSLRTVGDWRADSAPWTGEFAGKIQYHNTSWYFQAANAWIFRAASGVEPFIVSQAGNATATGDYRAPIYYDSADTFFYLNLNGYSQVNGFGSVNGSAGAGMSIMGNPANGAIMSFHRSAAFAVNMGLDTDNVIRIGGWSAGANRLQMDMSGNLTMAGNVTAFSDIRLKKDIETIDGALDLVSKMRGVRFTRIENEERNVGVIAQEMLEVCPEVVQQGVGDDDTLSVAYGNLVGVLIEAIKELTARVVELEGN